MQFGKEAALVHVARVLADEPRVSVPSPHRTLGRECVLTEAGYVLCCMQSGTGTPRLALKETVDLGAGMDLSSLGGTAVVATVRQSVDYVLLASASWWNRLKQTLFDLFVAGLYGPAKVELKTTHRGKLHCCNEQRCKHHPAYSKALPGLQSVLVDQLHGPEILVHHLCP